MLHFVSYSLDETCSMTSTLPSGIVTAGAVFVSACFHPNYDHPTCGPNGECPDGLSCTQEVCEESIGVGATQSDAGVLDASSICDPTGTFDAPVPLTGFNTASSERVHGLTADELELYFDGGADIYRAQRSTTSQPFGAPMTLTQVDTAAGELNPSVSSDGLKLFFESYLGPGVHLYMSTRTSRVAEFRTPFEVANVNSATVTDNDLQPFVTADGQELWFVSNRGGGFGGEDIYRAVWNGFSFANVAAITALSTNARDFLPTLSADKLTIYLSSNRPGGKGDFDIWTAHRSTTSEGFPTPTPVPELNSSVTEFVGWLSLDNCRMYFTSDVAGSFDIYVATRHPLSHG
jgi:Tol biopolymer transport system component